MPHKTAAHFLYESLYTQSHILGPTSTFDSLNKQTYINGYNVVKYRLFQKYFKSLYLPYWSKLNFRGKGFRIRNFGKSAKFTLNFGRSHWTKLTYQSKQWYFMRVRRQLHVFWSFERVNFYNFCLDVRLIKKVNKYTKRGLRLKRQYIVKRFGKISQMVSSLQM